METRNKAIKQIVTQAGWEYIEDVFNEEVLDGSKPLNFKTDGKTPEIIALELMARERAATIVDNVLKKLKRIASSTDYKKEVWK